MHIKARDKHLRGGKRSFFAAGDEPFRSCARNGLEGVGCRGGRLKGDTRVDFSEKSDKRRAQEMDRFAQRSWHVTWWT